MRRKANQLREVVIEGFPTSAAGSVLIRSGETRVLCTASIASETPRWIERDEEGRPVKGWVTAEYSMLPGSTGDRKRRGPDGRSTEIQRLIGRSLRAGVDLSKMPGMAITCDCDVLSADGGTRTAAITGSWVALAQAIAVARGDGRLAKNPLRGPIAAVSVGVIDGVSYLDLDYALDSRAEVDLNVVMDHKGSFVEVQGTAEGAVFDRKRLDGLLDLASKGVKSLVRLQKQALKELAGA
ncbi:ribonuclease PH [Mucisphaera sp.]|uniref:ribonuclease PH n=1 Tax=Mucisphaera sp. TaxID=2913024 RepID=UPI003D117312